MAFEYLVVKGEDIVFRGSYNDALRYQKENEGKVYRNHYGRLVKVK